MMRAVYGAADVYVSPYRAEGFNLPVLEATACGLPTIVTQGGPTDDFCRALSSRFVESRLTREPIDGQDAPGEYLEPSLDSLIASMEAEIHGGAKISQHRREISKSVNTENKWSVIAEQYVKLLGASPERQTGESSSKLLTAPIFPAQGRRFFNRKYDVIVLIPVYKIQLDDAEVFSIRQSLSKLRPGRRIRFIAPEGIDREFYNSNFPGIQFDLYPPDFFSSIEGYNYLLLSADFYKEYSNYEFILIHQADAILLDDDLDYWCAQEYDYIGAPWPAGLDIKFSQDGRFSADLVTLRAYVGNGGLSLRRTSAILKLLKDYQRELQDYCKYGFKDLVGRNEDVFFSGIGQLSKDFVIPDPVTASLFSTEYPPDYYLQYNGNRPPMGGHAWAKFNPAFWLKLIGDSEVSSINSIK
jgi:glycosyltransferase involved in cell wall biosynthesis